MKIMITGATGTLGSQLMRSLAPQHDCFGIYRSQFMSDVHPLFPCDLAKREQVEVLCQKQNPELIIHCAALTNVSLCESNPNQALLDNVLATINLAKWSGEHHVPMYFISTDQIFDGEAEGAYSEEDQSKAQNWYARTKIWAEQSVLELNPLGVNFRTNFFSESHGFFLWTMQSLLKQNRFYAFTDITFNPLYIMDLVAIMKDLIGKSLPQTLNLASSQGMSKADFIFHCADLFELDSDCVTKAISHEHLDVKRPRNMLLDIHKLTQLYPNINSSLQGLKKLQTNLFKKIKSEEWSLHEYFLEGKK